MFVVGLVVTDGGHRFEVGKDAEVVGQVGGLKRGKQESVIRNCVRGLLKLEAVGGEN